MAAKVLKSNDATQAEEFRRECALLERLRHLHIVQFYAHILGEDGTVGIRMRTRGKRSAESNYEKGKAWQTLWAELGADLSDTEHRHGFQDPLTLSRMPCTKLVLLLLFGHQPQKS